MVCKGCVQSGAWDSRHPWRCTWWYTPDGVYGDTPLKVYMVIHPWRCIWWYTPDGVYGVFGVRTRYSLIVRLRVYGELVRWGWSTHIYNLNKHQLHRNEPRSGYIYILLILHILLYKWQYVCLSVCLSVCMSVCLSVCLAVCLAVCLGTMGASNRNIFDPNLTWRFRMLRIASMLAPRIIHARMHTLERFVFNDM
jgi:hypothetical protein